MDNSGLYSLLPDAPDAFDRRAPTAVEMKQGLIVFLADSYTDALKSTLGVYPGVAGIIISRSSQMSLKEIRPTLWHVSVPDSLVPSVHEIAELLLSMVRRQVQSRQQLQKEMALTRDVALELQKKNQLLDGITANFPGVIYQFSVIADDRVEVSYLSDGAVEMLGISPEDTDTFDALVANIHPDERTDFVAHLIASSKSRLSWQTEIRYLRQTGEVLRLRWIASLRDENGSRVFNGVVMDISEEVQLQEMLVQSEKMMSIGGLAAGMAHEINNPLAGLMHSIQVIQNRLSTDHPDNLKAATNNNTSLTALKGYLNDRAVLRTISRMKEACERVSTIVLDMLSFARRGGQEFQFRDIAKLLDQTINIASTDYDLARNYDFRRIRIIRQYQDDIPMVNCVPSKLQQVFINILRNGARAMNDFKKVRSFQPTFTLRVEYDDARKWVLLQIIDNGPGIPTDLHHKIFEPFFTTREPGEGTGLGLSVSYFIITREHRGELSVDSIEGQGSCFKVGMPIEPTLG